MRVLIPVGMVLLPPLARAEQTESDHKLLQSQCRMVPLHAPIMQIPNGANFQRTPDNE
jgi:hypothetical protein